MQFSVRRHVTTDRADQIDGWTNGPGQLMLVNGFFGDEETLKVGAMMPFDYLVIKRSPPGFRGQTSAGTCSYGIFFCEFRINDWLYYGS
jgi:hypothetical protein